VSAVTPKRVGQSNEWYVVINGISVLSPSNASLPSPDGSSFSVEVALMEREAVEGQLADD